MATPHPATPPSDDLASSRTGLGPTTPRSARPAWSCVCLRAPPLLPEAPRPQDAIMLAGDVGCSGATLQPRSAGHLASGRPSRMSRLQPRGCAHLPAPMPAPGLPSDHRRCAERDVPPFSHEVALPPYRAAPRNCPPAFHQPFSNSPQACSAVVPGCQVLLSLDERRCSGAVMKLRSPP